MERLYALQFAAAGDHLALAMDGVPLLEARDGRYRSGGAGFVIDEGTMLADGFGVVERVVEEIAPPWMPWMPWMSPRPNCGTLG